MAEEPKPQLGDYATARRAIHGDNRDHIRDEGVVVGVPKKKGDYYRLLNPYDPSAPFDGHVDDAQVIPDDQLRPFQKEYKEAVNKQLKGDDTSSRG